MGKPLVPDALWLAIEPLLPPDLAKPKGGRPRGSDRAALAGIVFVLRLGIPWEMLPEMPPAEIGCSGMTCWRRLRDWQAAGVWKALHRVLLERLSDADRLDWSHASLDSASIAEGTGPNPLERGKPGTKRHVVATAKERRSASRQARPSGTTA